jgi:hypothetical protein
MNRRGFFGALLALPALMRARLKSEPPRIGFDDLDITGPPVLVLDESTRVYAVRVRTL